jgi:Leucine-rich repeat (LRR) protein
MTCALFSRCLRKELPFSSSSVVIHVGRDGNLPSQSVLERIRGLLHVCTDRSAACVLTYVPATAQICSPACRCVALDALQGCCSRIETLRLHNCGLAKDRCVAITSLLGTRGGGGSNNRRIVLGHTEDSAESSCDNWSALRELDLGFNDIGPESALFDALAYLMNLRTLRLANNKLRPSGCALLYPLLVGPRRDNRSMLYQLSILDLASNEVGDEGVKVLASSGLAHLSQLILSDNGIGDIGVKPLVGRVLRSCLFVFVCVYCTADCFKSSLPQ